MQPVKPQPSNWWKETPTVVRPAASTIATHFARKLSPSRRSCGSQRQPVRSPMRCRPFIFLSSKTRRRGPPMKVQATPSICATFVRYCDLRSRSIRAKPPKYSNLLVRLSDQLLTNRIDQSASDRDFAWKFRQLQYVEPLCFLDFGFLRSHLAALPVADERDHQRVRERPRLAREVADVVYAHADFLVHLAREALLERLAGLDEPGERAVHAGRKVRASGQQKLFFPMNERHDRRRHSGIGRELAGRADAHPLVGFRLRRRAAAPAELVRAVPGDELQRPAGERELRVVQHAEECPQSGPGHSGWRLGLLRQLGGPALLASQPP